MDIRSKETAEERREMTKQYWSLYSSPTIESMLLSHEGKNFDEAERNEILSTLPSFKGAEVLDLGAGIGRFTSRFAETAKHVTATDLMEPFIEENRRTNAHFGNITFRCDDIRNLDFPEASFDLVFSNWMLIYLTNEELEVFVAKILRWLRPGGHFFFKESCYHAGGTIIRPSNPSIYRNPLEYLLLIRKTTVDGNKFALKTTKNIFTLTFFQSNPYQICFLVEKTNEDFVDDEFERCIDPRLSYDEIINKGFPATLSWLQNVKGEELLKGVGKALDLCEGKRVLVIGSQGEYVSRYLVEKFEVFLHAIIASPLLNCKAIENQGKLDEKIKKMIQYESTNWIETISPKEKYDCVLCLDLMLTKENTAIMASKAKQCLKEDGRLALTLFVDNGIYEQEDIRHFQKAEDIIATLKANKFSDFSLQQNDFGNNSVRNLKASLSQDRSVIENQKSSDDDKILLNGFNDKIRLLTPDNIALQTIIAKN